MQRVFAPLLVALASCWLVPLAFGSTAEDNAELLGLVVRIGGDDMTLLQQLVRLNRSHVTALVSPVDPDARVREGANPLTLPPVAAAQREHEMLHGLPKTAAEAAGVRRNRAGDLPAFLSALFSNSLVVVGIIIAFAFLSFLYPDVYSHNVKEGWAPKTSLDGRLGWLWASLNTTSEQVEEAAGLDQAMLLQFANLGMRISAQIGVPLVVLSGPLNYFLGGHAAGDDRLSYFSMGNIVEDSWLYWVHAAFVWGVVHIVLRCIYDAQRAFLPRRFQWLRRMPEPRCSTVMVEGIPYNFRSDKALRKFFVEMFSEDKVKSAYIAKDTSQLLALIAQKEYIGNTLQETQHVWEKGGGDEIKRPMMLTYTGHRVDSIEYYTAQVEDIAKEISKERQRINSDVDVVGGVNGAAGFVTFHKRGDAEIAQRLNYSPDEWEWVVSTPPGPDSVRWSDFLLTQDKGKAEHAFGYALVAGLYVAYLPIVVGIAKYAGMINMGPFQAIWQGIAPSLGLTLMVSFLPSLLIFIFKSFFVLKDEAWAQHRLQNYYFCFNVTFIILVTAIGGSVVEFATVLATKPMSIFSLLGATMPNSTHFYMNFLVLQWVTHSLNMLRYVNLAKYLALRKIYGDEEAKKMSEPEDQDYYGVGSRSARWTTNMLIGIVFSTLCPPIAVLTFLNFLICRIEYGYLIPFAETKKADLGGAMFVQKLDHVFVGLVIYCIMMVGVLAGRASNLGPAIVAFPSLLVVALSWRRFKTMFDWEKLPFTELVREEQVEAQPHSAEYSQQELEQPKDVAVDGADH